MTRMLVCFVFLLSPIRVVLAFSDTTYFGVKAGLMMTDLPRLSNSKNIGLVLGSKLNGNFSIEGEVTLKASKGDLVDIVGFSGEWGVKTIAGYGVYRGNNGEGSYPIGKVGLLHEEVYVITPGFGLDRKTTSDTGLSLGIGMGFDIGDNYTLEIEYTIIESDINFLSIGVIF